MHLSINQKLVFGFLFITLLMGVLAMYSANAAQNSLIASIDRGSQSLADEMLKRLNYNLQHIVDQVSRYSQSEFLREAVVRSNKEYNDKRNTAAYISKLDSAWISAPKETITQHMQALIESDLSYRFRDYYISFWKKKQGYSQFAEVFVTNRYGANVAQTGKTTDFYQGDEDWWQIAREKDRYFGDIEYDENVNEYIVPFAVKITDGEGNFLGVHKAAISILGVIQETSLMIRANESTAITMISKKHGSLLYSTRPFHFFEDVSDKPYYHKIQGQHGSFFETVGVQKKFFSYVLSSGLEPYGGFEWVIVMEHNEKGILEPVYKLKTRLYGAAYFLILMGLLISYFISRSILKPIEELHKGTKIIGTGNLDYRINSQTADEIGSLSRDFDRMAADLSTVTASRDELNREIGIRKAAEKELKISEKKYADLYDNAPDMYVSVDARTSNVRECNQTLAAALGYAKEEIIGRSVFDLYDPDSLPKARDTFKQFVATGEVIDAELQLQHKNGRKIDVSLNVSAVRDESGNIIASRSSWRDITDKKTAEMKIANYAGDLERSNKELEQFAYVASHDLQEPLRMVASYTQLLARRYGGKLDDDAHEFIKFAVDGAHRMQGLINDLLTYSRVGTKGKPFEYVAADHVIQLVLSNLEMAIREAGAIIKGADLPQVYCDPVQLGQVFQNLIGNAIKFKGEEKPLIRISAEAVAGTSKHSIQSLNSGAGANTQTWLFKVQDNGIGIEEQYLERIFQIFQRLHLRSEYAGTGIGLAVCKKIVERHGGSIWAESEKEHGSVFFFTLIGKP